MKKIICKKNPELFQGEKNIPTNKNYFEGWYFKISNNKTGISFISGISINEQTKKAFIQVITQGSSYYIDYSIKDFSFSNNPFYIKIGDNYFSKSNIHIDINDKNQNLVIYGNIQFSDGKNIKTNFLNTNIMGPFSYIPFMECNHAILHMKNRANGSITINNKKINFKNSIGYIEKDWGTSFPKAYIWCQANGFQTRNASFILSIADIPFKIFQFRGMICSLIIDNHEFRFATYNNAKLIKYNIDNNSINISIKKRKYLLNIKAKSSTGHRLVAPIKGKMEKDILESITATVFLTLKKNNKIIFSDTSRNCGLEIVHK